MRRIGLHWFGAAALAAVLSSGLLVTGTGPAGAAPAKGTPIKFGVISALTGPEAFPESTQALSAYVKNWNAHGGYKGHPIQIIVEDSQTNPTVMVSDARTLVLQDGVIGIDDAAAQPSTLDCILNNQFFISSAIGVLGGGCSGSDNPKYDFPGAVLSGNSSGTAGLSAEVKFALSQGAKKIAILGFPALVALQTQLNNLRTYTTRTSGSSSTLVWPTIITPTVPTAADIDAAIATMKADGVDTVLAFSQTPQLLIQEANRQGFGPTNGIRYIFGVNITAPKDAASLPGAYVLDSVYPWNDNRPSVKAAVKLLKGHVSSLDSLAGFGYDSGATLQAVLNNVKGPVTRASFIKAMEDTTLVPQPLSPISIDLPKPSKIPYEGGTILKSVNGVWKQVSPFYVIKIQS